MLASPANGNFVLLFDRAFSIAPTATDAAVCRVPERRNPMQTAAFFSFEKYFPVSICKNRPNWISDYMKVYNLRPRCRSPPSSFDLTHFKKSKEERKMKNYTYDTATGPVTIELDEKWAAYLTKADAEGVNANRRHTRPDHKYAPGAPVSLDSLEYDGDWLADQNDGIALAELSIDLERAMASLTDLQRRYVSEVYLCGCSYAELARKDSISEAAVRKHVKLAITKLKNYFVDGSDSVFPTAIQ
jgi:RNA polymerase sigma factor (sigma-70 family)